MALGISLLNFATIQHKLLIENVPWLERLFPTQLYFAVAAFAVYAPIAVCLGYLDYKRLSVPRDLKLANKANPFSRDLARALTLISRGDNEEARAILKEWV